MKRGKLAALLAVGALMLALTAGAALALTMVQCPNISGTNHCRGTPGGDVMTGTDADDVISGRRGRDIINDTAKQDVDTISGNRGHDTIDVREGNSGLVNRDLVDCGRGRDRVFFDNKGANSDKVVRCEIKNPG